MAYTLTRSVPAGGGNAPSSFKSLGVEPFINCGGVRSTFGGSRILPQAMESMNRAAEEFVDLDELAMAVGQELATITGAQWGIVTSCSTAAMALATAACIAGHNPERMLRLPDTRGMPNKVAIARSHRFAYDFVFNTVGATLVEFTSVEELLKILDGSVAMICLLGRANSSERFSNADIIHIANDKRIPVLVDAAAQTPTYPDRWLEAGADLVVYAGGKFLRGPQSTGFLLGAENLCKMAWLNGPPHQAFGRAMKVGKEEIIGAVHALRHFLHERDANAEALTMDRYLETIDKHLRRTSVTTQIIPTSATWHSPRLRISWDRDALALTGEAVRVALDHSRPRIHIHDVWLSENSIVLDPFNFRDGDADIVGSTLARLFLTHLRKVTLEPTPQTLDLSGSWEVQIDYLHGRAVHEFQLTTVENAISGSHRSLDSNGEISGTIDGKRAQLIASHAGDPICVYYSFAGEFDGDIMSGEVALGAAIAEHFGPVFRRQFGAVRWSARRKRSGLHAQTASSEDHVS